MPPIDPSNAVDQLFAPLRALATTAADGLTHPAHPEAAILTRSTALNTLFADLTKLAFTHQSTPHFAPLLRLALRSQSQSFRALNDPTLQNSVRLAQSSPLPHPTPSASADLTTLNPEP